MKYVLTLLSLFTVSTFVSAHECNDVAGWLDSEDDGCGWYAIPLEDDDVFEDRCDAFGNSHENDGHTAQTACCVCGGGEDFLDTCEDVADFTDCGGDTCDFYANGKVGDDDYVYGDDYDDAAGTVCSYWGYRCTGPSGLTANEACCICGGGVSDTNKGSKSGKSASNKGGKSGKSASYKGSKSDADKKSRI